MSFGIAVSRKSAEKFNSSLFPYFLICISNSFFPPVAAVFKGHSVRIRQSITSWQRHTTLQEHDISFFLHQFFRMQKESIVIYYFLFLFVFFSLLMWNHWNLVPLAVTLCYTTELHCGGWSFCTLRSSTDINILASVQHWAEQILDTVMHR